MNEDVKDFYKAIGKKLTDADIALSDIRATIFAEIRIYRRDNNLTQKQMAEKMGISVGTLAKLEYGGYSPRIDLLNRIAYALGGKFEVVFELNKKEVVE